MKVYLSIITFCISFSTFSKTSENQKINDYSNSEQYQSDINSAMKEMNRKRLEKLKEAEERKLKYLNRVKEEKSKDE